MFIIEDAKTGCEATGSGPVRLFAPPGYTGQAVICRRRQRALLAAAAAIAVVVLTPILLSSHLKGPLPTILVEQRAIYERRPRPGGTVYRDLIYHSAPFNRQGLDIYMPESEAASDATTAAVPGILFIHGGSWLHGSKEDIRVIDRFVGKMRRRGWAVISIDYVASPLGLLDVPSRNVRRAMDWVRDHAEDYGIDPQKLGLYSVSAGSHLALEALVSEKDPASRWRFWLNEYGPADLVAMANGEAFEDSERLARLPNRYLRRHSPLLDVDGPLPPTAIVHGDADRTVALAQSERLAEVLAAYGTEVSLTVIPGGDHGFFNKSQAEWSAMEDDFILFMARHFGTARIPPEPGVQ